MVHSSVCMHVHKIQPHTRAHLDQRGHGPQEAELQRHLDERGGGLLRAVVAVVGGSGGGLEEHAPEDGQGAVAARCVVLCFRGRM